MSNPVATITNSTLDLSRVIVRYRRILWSTIRVELAKRYAGSLFGMFWVVLYPALLLAMYLFVYLVIFKMRFPGYSKMHYVLYVFTGLVPYLGFSDALSTGTVCVKQNMHLVKNVMLPIELVPARVVLTSMVGQVVSLGVLVLLIVIHGSLSPHILWLPVVFVLQILFLVGLTWILSALAVPLPDVGYLVQLLLLFLLFVSPIAFKLDMVPPSFLFVVYLNPIFYMAEMFRSSLLYGTLPAWPIAAVYVTMCLGTFALGAAFFRKFKAFLVDYE